MDLSACGAASDINPHQYSDKLASGKKNKNLKMLQPHFPIGKAIRVILMEQSKKSSNSQVKKLGFEGQDGPIEGESVLFYREPWGFFLLCRTGSYQCSKDMNFIVLHKPFNFSYNYW